MTDPLERIAAALERMAPPVPAPGDIAGAATLLWRNGALRPARVVAALPLDALVGIDRQKAALVDNVRRHAAGHAAQDVLLWGARGTGKSALVKSAVAAVQGEGGALTLVDAGDVSGLAALFGVLAELERRFAVFVDDLGFDGPGHGGQDGARALRSLLGGGAEERPDNVRLLVTSNRRHLLPRDLEEQASAINPRDGVDDQLALADRFGLSLGFHAIDQDTYLGIVAAHAAARGLQFDPGDAVGWATRRGSRSGRVAWQYVVELAGRAGRGV